MSSLGGFDRSAWMDALEHPGGCPICGRGGTPETRGKHERRRCMVLKDSPREVGGVTYPNPAGEFVHCTSGGDGDIQPLDAAYVKHRSTGSFGTLFVRQNPGGARASNGPRPARPAPDRSIQSEPNKRDASKIDAARRVWDSSAAGRAELAAYLTARGRSQATIEAVTDARFAAACTFGTSQLVHGDPQADDNPRGTIDLPAAIFAVRERPGGDLVGVQRIALELTADRDGVLTAHKSTRLVNPKLSLGELAGGACWFGVPANGELPSRTLLLCEGPETALALWEATGYATAACISTSGLLAIDLAGLVEDEAVETVVVCADADAERWRLRRRVRGSDEHGQPDDRIETIDFEPDGRGWRSAEARQLGMAGQRVARRAAERLRTLHPTVRVAVSYPQSASLMRWDSRAITHHGAAAGEWVPKDPAAKSVDFEDVVNEGQRGGPRTLKWINRSIEQATRGAPHDDSLAANRGSGMPPPRDPLDVGELAWDDEHQLPKQSSEVARRFLIDCFASDDPSRPGGGVFRLVWLKETWLVYGSSREDEQGRWIKRSDEWVRGPLRKWLETRWVLKRDGIDDEGEPVYKQVQYAPTSRSMAEFLDALRLLTFVDAESLPVWLASCYNERNDPVGFHVDPAQRTLDAAGMARAGLPEPAEFISFTNGIMPIESLLAGSPELWPHDERLLSTITLGFEWPEEATGEAFRANIDGWLADKARHWTAHLKHCSAGDPVWAKCLRRFIGKTIVRRFDDEKMPYLHGAGGSGKGTTMDVVAKILGQACVPQFALGKLLDPVHVVSLFDKSAVIFGEADNGDFDRTSVASVLKTMASGEHMDGRNLYAEPLRFPNTALPWLVGNRLVKLKDPGDALVNRLVFLHFGQGVRGTVRQDPRYKKLVLGDAQYALVDAIWNGLRDYLLALRDGEQAIPLPRSHYEGVGLFRDMSNDIGRFVEDYLEPAHEPVDGDVPWMSVERLYQAYMRHAGITEATGARMSKARFAGDLKAEIGWAKHRPTKRMQLKGNAKAKVAAFEGVRMRPGVADAVFGTDLDLENGVSPIEGVDGMHPQRDDRPSEDAA
ncbi:MAG: toprim domain-containing protein [Planctomycetota bacterium]